MTILAKTFLPAKTIFVSPVFTMEKTGFSTVWQKPANLVSQALRCNKYCISAYTVFGCKNQDRDDPCFKQTKSYAVLNVNNNIMDMR